VALTAGSATSPATTSLAVGTRVITAEYAGSTDFGASTGTLAGGQVVNPAATTTAVSSSVNPSALGQSVTFTATVTAVAPGAGTPAGSVRFRVDDANFGSPPNVTLVNGVATSSATSSLTLGAHTVTADYAGTTTFAPSADTLDQVVESAGAAATLQVTGMPDPVPAGTPAGLTVTARDGLGNAATGYTGTVSFTSSDATAELPAPYAFVAGDAGTHTFSGIQLRTAGEQNITATDQVNAAITGTQSAITVQAGAASAAQTTAVVPLTGTAGSPTAITITVRDANNNKVTGAAGQVAGGVTGANTATLAAAVEQTGDTSYATSYTPALVGPDAVAITLGGIAISGSPFATVVGPGAAASVVPVEGDGQIGLVGKAVNVPPAVLVEDALGNPVPGAAVTFTVTGGGGSATSTTPVTDAAGVARVASWTLGPGVGANALQAAVTGADVSFGATGQAAAYDVDVRYFGTLPTTTQQAAFTAAAARWEQLIFGEVTDVPVDFAADWCGTDVTGLPALAETIDDLVIYAEVTPIDDAGGILGQAGPCYVRTTGGLPLLGIMQFDSADLDALEAQGQLEPVILHEMGHVVGLGTLWNNPPFSLLASPCPASGTCNTDPHFTGARGLAAFDAVGGTAYVAGDKVPVEDTGGAGTRNGHWRDDVFANELMTGFLSAGSNPLSIVSVGSFWDMGYLVNYADADTFAWSASPPAFLRGGINVGEDILRLPIGVVGPGGQVERVIQPSP
jgi:Bacterial Ig-like domain (group 3)/Bacterial Ig-like domain (group 1)/Leishmanolysin/Filamin/ABP280 repeat